MPLFNLDTLSFSYCYSQTLDNYWEWMHIFSLVERCQAPKIVFVIFGAHEPVPNTSFLSQCGVYTCKVVEGCGDVLGGIPICGVAHDEAGLPHGAVSHQDTVHPSFQCWPGPAPLHTHREVPGFQEPRRDRGTVEDAQSSEDGLWDAAGFGFPHVLRQHVWTKEHAGF